MDQHIEPANHPHKTNRRYPRYPFRARVLISSENQNLGRWWATIDNVSMGGMFVHSPVALEVDEILRVKVVPRDETHFRAKCRVVYVIQGVGFGCAFVEITPPSEFRLARWLGRSGGLPPVSGSIH